MDQLFGLRHEDLNNENHSSDLPSVTEKCFIEDKLPNFMNNSSYRKEL